MSYKQHISIHVLLSVHDHILHIHKKYIILYQVKTCICETLTKQRLDPNVSRHTRNKKKNSEGKGTYETGFFQKLIILYTAHYMNFVSILRQSTPPLEMYVILRKRLLYVQCTLQNSLEYNSYYSLLCLSSIFYYYYFFSSLLFLRLFFL